ncbi:polyprenol phosphomannose-dependent alpha 1,6 mannosyltransferase MptB [Streptomyces sp. MUM 203J]|uniref:polyprenol phosphomannose-dependent alpha 1,6 mannosyltransferase MptB n=1 Tax=Streptomyces sp. MUM 203J TaxID=2791990 RepID=UPI001F03855C|nr:polyprenol phosphomannose-dependent alpha 1,6 mannosyltransferase MptB [Streptomyces sp. MUM 203J]MCH0541089.1 polyprenol phosphomannose-dependent alpha 1,6 mannosyltransferase MptB [Streptomyces sp. MUM 203J]
MWSLSVAGCRRLGVIGSLAVALGGWAAGTLPDRDPWGLWLSHGPRAAEAGTLLAYAGLTLLVVAWWRYGRLLALRPSSVRVHDGLTTLGWWAAPLLLAPPLYSADVYSYIAQGAMVVEGHDVYAAGPSVLDPAGLGGDAAASVGGHWTDTPAPYGPVFLLVAEGVVQATDGRIVPAVLGMRLVAVGALALIVWALLRLAPRGARDGALWLGALNPLMIVHVVGGMHNDGLMIALLLAGAALALRGRRWIAGSALVGLAMMIKSPAALGLLFIGVVLARETAGPPIRRWAKALLGPGTVAGAVAVAATLVSGTGFGWLRTQNVAGSIHTALSLTSDAGFALGRWMHYFSGTHPDPVKRAIQAMGLTLALALIAYLAAHVLRGLLDPVKALGLSLLVLVLLSPVVQPWYLLWAVPLLAATAWRGRTARAVAVLSAAFVYVTAPDGRTPAYAFAAAAVACAVAAHRTLRGEPAAVPAPARIPAPRHPEDHPSPAILFRPPIS